MSFPRTGLRPGTGGPVTGGLAGRKIPALSGSLQPRGWRLRHWAAGRWVPALQLVQSRRVHPRSPLGRRAARSRPGRRTRLPAGAGIPGAGPGAARPSRPGAALALLERLHAAAVSQDRAGSVIEIQALQALALAAVGDQTVAVDALAGALTLASPQGYVRVFADEGPPMAALLGALVAAQRAEQAAARGVPLGFLARVLGAFGEKPAAPRAGRDTAAVVPGLVEQLTDRELQVLRLLAAGRSNQRIAHDLVVALNTVKKHVTHVLGKLGAANRTEAVARARQFGLIP